MRICSKSFGVLASINEHSISMSYCKQKNGKGKGKERHSRWKGCYMSKTQKQSLAVPGEWQRGVRLES